MQAGSEPYHLADWRRRIATLHAEIRAEPSPERGWKLWQETRAQLVRSHPKSPLPPGTRESFPGFDLYPYDPDFRFTVSLISDEGPTIDANLGADGRLLFRRIAYTSGLALSLGSELPVYWIEGYGGGLFLPFRDGTSGQETYGGGRYLIDAIKGVDLGLDGEGHLVLDFNFAYHPTCAMSDAFVCPLAPPEARVPAKVRAGERLQKSAASLSSF